MLLNIFFENMNASLELLLIGAVIFAVYWFLLRRFNSLGLRLFVLCALLFIANCVWLYRDERTLQHTLQAGEEHIAMVKAKSKTGKNNNQVDLSFTATDGTAVTASTSEYVSQEEWNRMETGKPISVIYVPDTGKTYVQQSIMRFKGDKIYLYFFAGFWLLFGSVLWIWLRNYKVGVDENTGSEWVEKPNGDIIFDERKSPAARALKRGNIFSKLIQSFGK
jgi:hypothetical protein